MAAFSPAGAAGSGVVVVEVEVVGVDLVVGVDDVVVAVVVVVADVVLVGGEAVVPEGVELVTEAGIDADLGAEEELPQPAAASTLRTSRASRDRRRRTLKTVAQAPRRRDVSGG